ncbi:unnamed protein product, partial [Mesorhabditis spiculigera]
MSNDWLWFQLYYYIIYLLAVLAKGMLLYTMWKAPGFCAKSCRIVFLNTLIADFLICTNLVLLVPRRMPAGDSIVLFAYGVCSAVPGMCEFLNVLWFVLLADGLMAITVSFFYRYFVLYHRTFEPKWSFVLCVAPYLIGIPFLIIGPNLSVTGAELTQIAVRENIEIPVGTVNFGYSTFLTPPLLLLHTYALYLTPVHCILMFWFRYKVNKYLDKSWALSRQTLSKHRALVKVLTIQMCMPLVHMLNIIIYILEQTSVLKLAYFDLAFVMIIHLCAASGGFVSLAIIRPYRKEVVRLFHRITTNSSHVSSISDHSLPPIKTPL